MYAIKNSYDIKDILKELGGVWNAEKKAWIISESALEECKSRCHTWGMRWVRGWGKVKIEKLDN